MNKYLVQFKNRSRVSVEADSYDSDGGFFNFELDDVKEPVLSVSKEEVVFVKNITAGAETPEATDESKEPEDSSEVS